MDKFKDCPKCGHPQGIGYCQRCHGNIDITFWTALSNRVDWEIFKSPSVVTYCVKPVTL